MASAARQVDTIAMYLHQEEQIGGQWGETKGSLLAMLYLANLLAVQGEVSSRLLEMPSYK